MTATEALPRGDELSVRKKMHAVCQNPYEKAVRASPSTKPAQLTPAANCALRDTLARRASEVVQKSSSHTDAPD